ncbi:MAG: hypothetical protein ACFFG0_51090, partial [Candidatus Thorarchaeota archaeon]
LILSIFAIIISIFINYWINKQNNKRLERTLNHEIELRNKRVQTIFDIIQNFFQLIEVNNPNKIDVIFSVNKTITIKNIETKDIKISSLLKFFENDFRYLWIDDINTNGYGLNFYDNGIQIKKGNHNISIHEGFYEEINEDSILIKDILNFILNKIKKDCKEHWGINLI